MADTGRKTAYHVLKKAESGDDRDATFILLGPNYEAHNAEQAVRDFVHTIGAAKAAGGTYVAVPARSWKLITVEVETQTVIKLGEAT